MTDFIGSATKRCRSCGTTKRLDEFYANPKGRDGTRPEC
jgi:hypothetical protein